MRALPIQLSKVTSKYQATIPSQIRKALHLQAGDSLVFEVKSTKDKATVTLKKASSVDIDYVRLLSHTLSEWDSPNDHEAYRDL